MDSVSWTINGQEAALSATVATLLALEDRGLCIVRLAMAVEDPTKGFSLMPGQAALALAVGRLQYLKESGEKSAEARMSVEALRTAYLTDARRLPAGTAKLALEGTGYLASLQKDMADGLEPEDTKGPKA